ncbi:MAG: starch synthase [Halothiobacillaceae bacterium]|nr:MAG: starch synthase [Halothiobacillaceae bacterium]
MSVNKILFVTSEAAPLVKTGGLGDVAGSLPAALLTLNTDIRVVMPAYRQALLAGEKLTLIGTIRLNGQRMVRLLEGTLPCTAVKLWLIDSPAHFDREGGPYGDPHGHDWPDNAERFALFARAVEQIALDRAGLEWQPEIVHCNDWQCGLIPALLAQHTPRPATVFTIHNMAYQGNFPGTTFATLRDTLQLPPQLWSLHGVEYHGMFSFMKSGLHYADMLNTVSPTYAREIQTHAYGYGFEGVLQHRAPRLRGILNGIDYTHWNPATDPLLVAHYDAHSLANKALNKTEVQNLFHLPTSQHVPLFGLVGRLVEQKGVDLVLATLPDLIARYGIQVALLGSGNSQTEDAFRQLAERFPNNLGVKIGFSEALAHKIEAGADLFLMPSRFEPCGLNQLYSLRYGTVPIVRHTGGLADTVVNTTAETLDRNTATGFSFHDTTPAALLACIERALEQFRDKIQWQQIMRRGMTTDFSWHRSAQEYLTLYAEAEQHRETDTQAR